MLMVCVGGDWEAGFKNSKVEIGLSVEDVLIPTAT